jgi:hypothetical protein
VLWFIIQLMRAKPSLFPQSDRGKKAKYKPQVNSALEPIYHATRAVEESRAANDGKHLSPGNQGPDDGCPSAADFPICCPCVWAGPTAKYMGIGDGLNLVVAPKRLLPVWVKEWNDTGKAHSLLNMTLLLRHGTAIQGVQTVNGFEGKGSLTVAEAEQWLHACACIQSANRSLHTEEIQALAATSKRAKGTIPQDASICDPLSPQ